MGCLMNTRMAPLAKTAVADSNITVFPQLFKCILFKKIFKSVCEIVPFVDLINWNVRIMLWIS